MKNPFKSIFSGNKNLNEKSEAKQEQPLKPKSVPGTVSILNNEIVVTDPEDSEIYATIFVPDEHALTVKINDERVTGEITVNASQKIEIEIEDEEEIYPQYELKTAVEERMFVYLSKEVVPGKRLSLPDTEPRRTIELKLVEQASFPNEISLDEIETVLHEAGYVGEILEEALKEVGSSKESTKILVMKGKEPIAGVPAYYKQVYEVEGINFVHKGTLVGEFQKETPGTPGLDVYGEMIPIEKENKIQRLGVGVREVGGKVYSEKEGRLVFDAREIDIIPQIIIERDLTEEDGEIIFEGGDVIVKGSILENCYVKAKGLVSVEGGVYHSTVHSEEGVIAKGNISNSKVYSGNTLTMFKKVNAITTRTLEYLEQFKEAKKIIDELESQNIQIAKDKDQTKEIGKYLNTVFAKLEEYAKMEFIEKDLEYKKIIEIIQTKWNVGVRKNLEEKDVERLIEMLEEYKKTVLEEQLQRRMGPVQAESITNSYVDASGSVSVGKSGVYLSRIETGDEIVVKGISRGGEIYAENSATIEELITYNTQNAHDFCVKVRNKEGFIKIGKRHPDTFIQVGDNSNTNDDMEYNTNFKGAVKKK